MKAFAPRPWKVDRRFDGIHWKNSCSIVDAEGGEICVLTRGYQGDASGGTPSWDNAELICIAVNAYNQENRQ